MSNTIDVGKMSQDTSSTQQQDGTAPEQTNIVPASMPGQSAIIPTPDLAWIEATQGLQTNLVRSLREYKLGFAGKRALQRERERMIKEVTEQYVDYLREEARLASKAALEARDSLLRQELAKLKSTLFVELADITGATVIEIERIAQGHLARINSPDIQRAYAQFVMSKIFNLLEQSG